MAEQQAPSIFTTENYLNGAFDEFGTNRYESMTHHLDTVLMDASEAVPVPHSLHAEVKHPVTMDEETGQFRVRGPRQLQLELRGAEVESIRTTNKHEDYSRSFVFTRSMDLGTPVLASTLFKFNTKQLSYFDGIVYADGHEAGIDEAAVHDYEHGVLRPNMLLGYFKDVFQTRSASLATVAGATVHTSLMLGQSKREVRADMRPKEAYDRLLREKGKPDPRSARRSDWMFVKYDQREQLTARPGSTVITESKHFTVDRHVEQQRIITDFGRLTVRAAKPKYEQLLSGAFSEDPLVFDGWYYDTTQGWQACVGSYTVETETLTFEPGSEMQRSHEVAADHAEARAMVQPFINAVARLRRAHHAA